MKRISEFFRLLFIGLIFLHQLSIYSQPCLGLDADAGPDLFTCDPSMPLQLQGSYSGNAMSWFWTPTNFLSDPNALDPTVNAPPGRYTYRLTVEAVSNNNLIVNGNFESGNSGFTHEYNYGTPGGPFSPGWLSVGTNPQAYNSGFSPCGDHTTGSGNQLIVDGSTTPNSKVWCQNVTLVPGRNYLFRFYVQSVFAVSPGVLIGTANNVSFGTVQAAALCDWQEFEACFTATSASVELCIRETTGVSFGNDFAIDDIQLYEKCMDTDDVTVEIVDLKAVMNIPNAPKCASDIFDLNAIGSSTGPLVKYEWRSDGGKIVSQNGLTAKGQGAGKYYLKVIYQNGFVYCDKEVELDVDPSDDLEALLDVDGIANCNNDTIILTATALNGSGNFDFQWIPANKVHRGLNTNKAYVTEAGLYKIVIIDKDSKCETEVQQVVVSDTIKPQVQILGDSVIHCKNTMAELFTQPFDSSRYSYLWTLPDSSIVTNKDSLQTSVQGLYSLRVIDKANKCFSVKNWNVKVDTLQPAIDLGPDLVIDCIQEMLTITPLNNNPNDSIDYFWTTPTSGKLPKETKLIPKTESTGGWVYLNLVNRNNFCSQTDSLFIEDKRQLPQIDATANDSLNCRNNSINLTASGNITDSLQFYWTTLNGNIVSGDSSTSPLVNKPGWYYLNSFDTTNFCKSTDSVYVYQDTTKPMALIGPDITFDCKDSIKILDASLSSMGIEYNYLWSSPNGVINAGQGSLILEVASPGSYTLIVSNKTNGCMDTATINVLANQNTPTASIALPDTLNCLLTSITLNGSASSPAGNTIVYQWSAANNQPISNSNSLQPTINEAGDYFLLVVDQVNGCSTLVRTTVSIDTLKPQAMAGPDLIWNCSSTVLQLDGSNSAGWNGLSYSWSTANGVISSNPNQDKININGPGKYVLQITDQGNFCSDADELDVIPDLTKPLALISIPDTINCVNASVILDGSFSTSGQRIVYNWYTPSGQISGPVNMNVCNAVSSGTFFLIALDTVNKCSDTTSVIVIEDKTKPIVDAGPSLNLDCATNEILLNGRILNPSGAETYSWFSFNGQINGSQDSINARIAKAGKYYLQIINPKNGCQGIDSVDVIQINSLVVDAGTALELSCNRKSIDLSATVFSGLGSENIIWTTSTGNITGNPNSLNITVDQPGVYYFRAENPSKGCLAVDSVLVTENTNYPRVVQFNVEQARCPGDSWYLDITRVLGGEPQINYYLNGQLLNGNTVSDMSVGVQQMNVVDKNGCRLDTSFITTAPAGISVQLIPYVKINSGDDYLLKPSFSLPVDSILNVEWSPVKFLDCFYCPTPTAQSVTEDIEYIVTVTSKNGCTSTARIKIEVIKRNIWIPNVFSPNGDNINDYFFPKVSEDSYEELVLMQIYDRWGNMLFQKEKIDPNIPRNGWNGLSNGEPVNPGVYIYYMELKWKNGEVQKFAGDLTLLR